MHAEKSKPAYPSIKLAHGAKSLHLTKQCPFWILVRFQFGVCAFVIASIRVNLTGAQCICPWQVGLTG